MRHYKIILAVCILALLVSPINAATTIKELQSFEKFEFDVGPDVYEIKVFSITSTLSASFSINPKSDPGTAIVVSLIKGETKTLDLNGDAVKETSLTLTSVGAGKVGIELNVDLETPPPPPPPAIEETPTTEQSEEASASEDINEPVVEDEPEDTVLNSVDESTAPVCGNGVVETDEDQDSCCLDAGCPSGFTCVNNLCEVEVIEEETVIPEETSIKIPAEILYVAIGIMTFIFVMVALYIYHGKVKETKHLEKHKNRITKFLQSHREKKPLELKKSLLKHGLSRKAVDKAFDEMGIEAPALKITNISHNKRKKLEFYIRQRLSYHADPQDIIDTLVNVGWDPKIVKETIKRLQEERDHF